MDEDEWIPPSEESDWDLDFDTDFDDDEDEYEDYGRIVCLEFYD